MTSDSFADLWASSAPTKSTLRHPENRPGPTVPPPRPQYDAFSILSASQPARSSAASTQPDDRRVRQPQPTSKGDDAFSALFSSSLDGSAGRNSDRVNMTMAERAVLAQKARAVRSSAVPAPTEPALAAASLWDGLDALARPATASPRPPVATEDSFDFAFDGVPVTAPQSNTSIQHDDWDLSEFTSYPSGSSIPTRLASGSQPTNLYDLDDFGSSAPRTLCSQPRPPSRSINGTPGDFDFGDREDGLLGGDNSDIEDTFGIHGEHSTHPEDDILGNLGKPVAHSHSPSPNPPTPTGGPFYSPRTTASPPPHVTGQLVEMGFSPIDARAALANTVTESGFDVQAAAELLLSQAGQEASLRPPSHPPERNRHRNGDRDTERDSDQAARRPPSTRTDTSSQNPKPIQTGAQSQLDVTAEKLLSQASEIGRGMFSKANALWKEGKERAVRMYEERATTANTAGATPVSDGRPRWMRDHNHVDNEWRRPNRDAVQGEFKDDEDEAQGREREERQSQLQMLSQPSPRPEPVRETDLIGADSPTTVYQSPYRRGKPKSSVLSSASPTALPTPSAASASNNSSTPQASSQPQRAFTTTIAASALSVSTSHKSAGTDAYKRGDFPVALAAYMRALSALPSEHVLRVPVLTNVALVRTKVGELRETIKACEEAVTIIRRFASSAGGEGSGGGDEISFMGTESDFDDRTPVDVGPGKVSVVVQGSGSAMQNEELPTSVDLVEGLSKAFRRRAEALEGLEKWDTARSTWEVLLGAQWAGAGIKGEGVKGVGRCRRMIGGNGAGDALSQSAPPKPRPTADPTVRSRPNPKPKPVQASSTLSPPSTALNALRSTNDAQQTEDAARLACKDTVDARLAAWKSGREGNIRALLSSLDDTVLWPELGWRKVGMAEVVSKGQVKGAYVRAIARVHPDKLNAGNTTVEQRMIANGVFGALNEAWNAFQQQ